MYLIDSIFFEQRGVGAEPFLARFSLAGLIFLFYLFGSLAELLRFIASDKSAAISSLTGYCIFCDLS